MKAPIVRRALAFFIDVLVAFLVLGAVSAAGLFIQSSSKEPAVKLAGLSVLLFAVVSFLGFVLVRDGLFGGRGVGKGIMRVKVVRCDGSCCDVVSSALRNVTLLVPFLNVLELIAGVMDTHGRRVGDRIAKTEVVE
jgi:uncharacterized RDD family membrane protein YckC